MKARDEKDSTFFETIQRTTTKLLLACAIADDDLSPRDSFTMLAERLTAESVSVSTRVNGLGILLAIFHLCVGHVGRARTGAEVFSCPIRFAYRSLARVSI